MKPELPDWKPQLPAGRSVLVVGASGGIGLATTRMLAEQGNQYIGAHFSSRNEPLRLMESDRVRPMKRVLQSAADCEALVGEFVEWRGTLDAVVIALGAIANPGHFSELSEDDWNKDIFINLSAPFFIARAALRIMGGNPGGGRIILFGTESAPYGGSPYSLPYGVSKYGTECLVKALAREGGPRNVLVNGIRLGYISTGFHERWQNKDAEVMKKRAEMVLLKRAGRPEEVASLVIYLMSDWASFITGEMYTIGGGDRL